MGGATAGFLGPAGYTQHPDFTRIIVEGKIAKFRRAVQSRFGEVNPSWAWLIFGNMLFLRLQDPTDAF